MNWNGAFTLAWRYVSRHRVQSALLALALGTVLALPLAVRVVVSAMEQQMRARARSTPLIAGPKGSSTDLMLSALHFQRSSAATMPISACDAVRDTGFAEAIPLHIRFHAQGAPIVGTELDYFDFRGLHLVEGEMLTRLGDCVVGARVAREKGLHAGGALFSSPEEVFNIAGVYPLKMRIVGVLAPTGTPDDEAVFVDLKTTWLIQGIAHGHEELQTADAKVVLSKEQDNVVGNAAVMMFNEVTDKNVDGFHFHGDDTAFPINAMLVIPHDVKSEALISGRYQGSKDLQLFRPIDVLETLLGTLFKVEKLIMAALLLVAAAAVSVAVLVFWLSFRMRQREFSTLADVGVSSGMLWCVRACEVCIIGGGALLVAIVARGIASTMAEALLLRGLLG